MRRLITQLTSLRPPVRALVALSWVYFFSGSLLGVFLQVYLYETFASLALNIIATLVLNTGIMLGFVVYGYIASMYQVQSKTGFILSFLAVSVSVPLLLVSTSEVAVYLTLLMNGVGQGLFWLTVHTYELTETTNHERDFYSSILSSGSILLDLLGPLVATTLILLSTNVGIGTYTLLFCAVPLVFVLGIPQFGYLKSYRPTRVVWHDITHFFSDKKNLSAQPYLAGSGAFHFLDALLPPLVAFTLLGSAVSVGVYSALLAFFSAACVFALAAFRTEHNRVGILAIASILLALITVYLGVSFTLFAFVLYSVALGVLNPVMSVSAHVIDLQTMESVGRPEADFYATMLLRDFSLWVWRMVIGLVFLCAVQYGVGVQGLLSVGLYLTAAMILLRLVGAVLLTRGTV